MARVRASCMGAQSLLEYPSVVAQECFGAFLVASCDLVDGFRHEAWPVQFRVAAALFDVFLGVAGAAHAPCGRAAPRRAFGRVFDGAPVLLGGSDRAFAPVGVDELVDVCAVTIGAGVRMAAERAGELLLVE